MTLKIAITLSLVRRGREMHTHPPSQPAKKKEEEVTGAIHEVYASPVQLYRVVSGVCMGVRLFAFPLVVLVVDERSF